MAARKGPDQVALILTLTVAVVVIGTAMVVLILEVLRPQQDHAAATEAIGRIVSVLVAALVGYMAGRATANGNGNL